MLKIKLIKQDNWRTTREYDYEVINILLPFPWGNIFVPISNAPIKKLPNSLYNHSFAKPIPP